MRCVPKLKRDSVVAKAYQLYILLHHKKTTTGFEMMVMIEHGLPCHVKP